MLSQHQNILNYNYDCWLTNATSADMETAVDGSKMYQNKWFHFCRIIGNIRTVTNLIWPQQNRMNITWRCRYMSFIKASKFAPKLDYLFRLTTKKIVQDPYHWSFVTGGSPSYKPMMTTGKKHQCNDIHAQNFEIISWPKRTLECSVSHYHFWLYSCI